MTTTQKVLIGAGAAAVIVGGIAIGLTVSRTPDKIDLSTIHTEAPEETMAQTEAPSSSVPAETLLYHTVFLPDNGKVSPLSDRVPSPSRGRDRFLLW